MTINVDIRAFVLVGLAACCPPRDAERQTYDVIAPEYSSYVQGDVKLTDEQKSRRLRTVDTWKVRVGR